MSSGESTDRAASERPNYRTAAILTTVALAVILIGVFLFDVAVSNRSIGVFEWLSPDIGVVVGVWGLVTQLGDPWFLLALATLVYLLGVERSLAEAPRDGAFVLAVTFAAFSFTDLLKNVFAAPRPPGAGTATIPEWLPPVLEGVFRSATVGAGYAFPSGHALGTTAVFLALASQLKIGSSPARWAVAGTGILLVAASRVVIGVHFVVDIVVGVAAGTSLFAVAAAVGDRRPLRVFALGIVLGVLAVAVSAGNPPGEVWKAGQWLGASLGAGLAWYLVRPAASLDARQTAVVGAPIAVLWVSIYLTSPPLLVTVVGTAALAGLVVSAPTLVRRVSDPA
jgi:membrane-associated phospholipid phosphatase